VENHRPAKGRESFGSLIRGLAAVDDHRQGELVGDCELSIEESTLFQWSRERTHAVEPCFSDGDRLGVREQLAELVKPLCLRRPRLVWIDA